MRIKAPTAIAVRAHRPHRLSEARSRPHANPVADQNFARLCEAFGEVLEGFTGSFYRCRHARQVVRVFASCFNDLPPLLYTGGEGVIAFSTAAHPPGKTLGHSFDSLPHRHDSTFTFGSSENRGTLFWGPYNNPTLFRVLY